MKREAIFLSVAFLLVLLIAASVLAADDPKVEKARTCLTDKVEDKCEDLSVEEQAFTLLAIGKCSSELQDKSKDDECWPSSGCRLRDTALSVLALDNAGKSTSDAEAWLLSQKKVPTELTWYLEIDADEETNCKITYSGEEKTITIAENKKINRNAGSCLSLAQDNYWLKIKDTCYEENFTISCDKDFKTTLLYSKKIISTIYVSSKTSSASSEGKTEERVNAFCFKQGTSCDYEGSLWAALALAKTGNDVSAFLPYLIAMAEDNEKYFPSAFLYAITGYDSYFTEIVNLQKDDYWKISSSSYHQFYDTSLAMLALYGTNAEQKESAKTYLLGVQDDKGCWHDNIRDTAFILFAGWQKAVSVNGGEVDECEDYNYYCTSPLDCEQEDKVNTLVCFGGKVCCKVEKQEETCDEKDGTECNEDQECTGSIVPASDTSNCCSGDCTAKVIEEPECEQEGHDCRSSCLEDEESDSSYECNGGDICCVPAPIPSPSYWWIWLLIILIILVVLAIIFRNQLKIWIFRAKSGFRRGPAPTGTAPRGFPPTSPSRPMPMTRPRMILPRQFQPVRPQPRPVRKEVSKSDKELEETLKKLKEMSK